MPSPNSILFNNFFADNAMAKWNFDVAFIFYDYAEDDYHTTEKVHSKNAVYSELLSKAVTNIKLPESRNDKLDTYLPGFHFAYPGKPGLNGEMTLTFNDDLSLTIRKVADYLLQYNYNPRFQQHDFFDNGADNYVSIAHTVVGNVSKPFVIAPKFDIYVRLYNCCNTFIQKIIYKNCFVKSIGPISLDYSGEELVKTEFTVSYPYFKVLDPDDMDQKMDDMMNFEVNNTNVGDTTINNDIPEQPQEDIHDSFTPDSSVKPPPMEEIVDEITVIPTPPIDEPPEEQDDGRNIERAAEDVDSGEVENLNIRPQNVNADENPQEDIIVNTSKTYEGVNIDKLKASLGKSEGSTDYVYSNIITDKMKVMNSTFSDEELTRMKNGEHIRRKGKEYFWNGQNFVHYDKATVGKGLTFAGALANQTVTLTNERGEVSTKTGKEWDDYFENAKLDSLPNGRGKQIGNTPTTENWTIDPVQAEDLFSNSLESYIKTAKKQAKKAGLDWDDLTEADRTMIADAAYNGGGGKALKVAKVIKELGGTIDSYEDVVALAKTDSLSMGHSLARIDNVYGTNYRSQYKES